MISREVVVTMGDPRGIGPEVLIKALKQIPSHDRILFRIIGCRVAFAALPDFEIIIKRPDVLFDDITIEPCNHFESLTPAQCGQLSFKALQKAVDVIQSNSEACLVTAPINKKNMQLAGFEFPGHTEYLCHEFGVNKFAMMLFHQTLRVVLATIHTPLSKVASQITENVLLEKLKLTERGLRNWFGIDKPRIAVCGLNPHAGEEGLLGTEEIEIIKPAITKYQQEYGDVCSVTGPLSADGVFYQAIQGHYDAVLCQYHDQGLAPLKTTGFHDGINLTLGLPFLRVSPDHGTATDLFGQNKANAGSMLAALRFAVENLIKPD